MHTPTLPRQKQPSTSSFFGMHMHRVEQIRNEGNEQSWPKVRFGAWRLWDAGVTWLDLEPKKGEWHFEKLDRYVALAEKHHVKVLLTLGQTPQWASARPLEPGPYAKGCAAEPREIEDWEAYVQTVVTRFKGRIEAYELWNEPDFSQVNPKGFYSGTPEKMVELAKVAHRVIKSVDPMALVTTPAVVSELERLEPYLRLGGAQFADIVAAHFYTMPPENFLVLVKRFRSVMARYGLESSPIWNTESGFLIANPLREVRSTPGSGVFERVLSESEAAAYVARSLILARANGIARSYWYAWDNSQMALSQDDSRIPNLAGRAYNQVVQWLENAGIENCSVTNGSIWICHVNRTDSRFWLVWSAAKPTDWTVPLNWNALRYQNLEGLSSPISSPTLMIGPSPMMLSSSRGAEDAIVR